jgi:hypothetical protein
MGSGGGGGMQAGDMFQMMQINDARANEELRQQRIRTGRDQIDRQFQSLQNPNDPFYARYGADMRSYYQPQIQKQYADSQKDLTYRLADAGTLRSGAAAELAADLSRQNDIAVAGMNSKIDSAKATLRSRVADQKNQAEQQLYATNDPDMGLTTALNGIQNIRLAPPDNSPLANMFSQAMVGGGNAIKSFADGGGMGMFGGGGSPPGGRAFSDRSKIIS